MAGLRGSGVCLLSHGREAGMSCILIFFKHLFILLMSSSISVCVSCITMIDFQRFDFTLESIYAISIVLLGFVVTGHVFSFPFLLLVYFPISLMLWNKNSHFAVLPFLSTSLAIVNGVVFTMIIINRAEWLFLGIFTVTGFFTGCIHYGLLCLNQKLSTYFAERKSNP